MIRRFASLPIRVLKRAISVMDGERNAPSPAPPMAPVAAPAAPPRAEATPTESAKPAPKKAPPKKRVAKAPKRSDIQVDPQETPNPNAMKFALSVKVAETGSFSFNSGDQDIAHPIAAAVVALEGVVSVFGVNDFITVSKAADVDWNDLLPRVVDAIKANA